LGRHNMVQSQYLEVSIAARANLDRHGVYDASSAWSPSAFVGSPWPASTQMIISIPGGHVSKYSRAYVVLVPRALPSILHFRP